MQAIILAAGMGKRLGELTKGNTKCMVTVNGISLIDRLLTQLCSVNLARVVIVVGYEGEKLQEYIGKRYDTKLKIEYINNPIYQQTNNIYSLALAKRKLVEVLNICVYTVQIMVLLLLKDYYIYVAVFIFSTITENIIIGKKAQIHFPYIEADGRISAEDKKVIIQHTKGIALQKVCSTSRNSLDSIVISMFLGLNMIAIYSNYYYIMISIHNILYQIPDSIRATVGNSVASESVDKNFRDFNCMYLLNMFICGWATCFLYCMFQPFMELWMGPNMMFSQVSVVLVCLYFTLLSLADVVALYKDAAGLWWYGRYRVLIEAIANLILNFVLGYFWGVNGILLATIITIILIGHGYGGWIVFHYYFKGKSFMTFVMKQVGYLVMIAVACYVTDFVCSFSLEILWIRLLSVGIITLFLSPILLLIMYRFFPEFKDSVDFAKNILKSFKR